MKHIGLFLAASLVLACNSSGGGSGRGGGGDNGEGGGGGEANGGGGSGSESGGAGGSGGKGGGAGGAKSGGNGGAAAGGSGGASNGGTGGALNAGGSASGGVGGPDLTKAPGCTQLDGVVRDFNANHPDFQYAALDPAWPEGHKGVIETTLGASKKPVLLPVGVGKLGIASSVESFNEWFNDKPGVNMTLPIKLPIKQATATSFEFGPTDLDGNFFPINDKGLGNLDFKPPSVPGDAIEGAIDLQNNQLLTLEVHTEFLYQGGKGEIIVANTDDDSWVFINGKLAVDDGGLNSDPWSLRLDEVAAQLGLEPGKRYPVDIFFADRQMVLSVFRFSSNLIWTGCAK